MAWSDAARRAAAEARRRKARGQVKSLVTKARDYYGSSRTQARSIQALARSGRSAYTGRKVGRKKARAIAFHIGDMAND